MKIENRASINVMDLIDAFVIAALTSCMGYAVSALPALIINMLFCTFEVYDFMQAAQLDHYLAMNGWCTVRTIDRSSLPTDGVHFGYVGFPFIALRTSKHRDVDYFYRVHVIGKNADKLREMLNGKPNETRVMDIVVMSEGNIIRTTYTEEVPQSLFTWQKTALSKMLKMYNAHNRVSVLICGPPGVGKSTMGIIFAKAINGKHTDCLTINNFNMATRGLSLESVTRLATKTHPVVIMFNEFDTTIDNVSIKDIIITSSHCIAEDSTSLLNAMDRLNKIKHLVCIFTTNVTSHAMKEKNDGRFTRKGRMDEIIDLHDA